MCLCGGDEIEGSTLGLFEGVSFLGPILKKYLLASNSKRPIFITISQNYLFIYLFLLYLSFNNFQFPQIYQTLS